MTALILDTRTTAATLRDQLKTDTADFTRRTGSPPSLVMVSVGEDRSIFDYIRVVTRSASAIGVRAYANLLPTDTTTAELKRHLAELNNNPNIDAISLQSPLPPHLNMSEVAHFLAPEKDVEGYHPANVGMLNYEDAPGYMSPPAAGAMKLLKLYSINPAGRNVVVVGRNPVIGRPLANMLTAANATVTLCHSKTQNLGMFLRQAEILVVAVQKPGLITGAMVRPGAVVLDFGINYVGDRVIGDVDFGSVSVAAGALTPMPGGTGPMTVVALLQNVLKAAEQHRPTPHAENYSAILGETIRIA